jgi:hypothetical protein
MGKITCENEQTKLTCKHYKQTSEFVPHDVERGIVVNFGRQILSGRQMFEPKQRVPMAGSTATRIMLNNLNVE